MSETLPPEYQLSSRVDEALAFAAEIHRDQARKGTTIPYLSHLLGVSGLVLEAGGTEDEAIAGLLHDALEDQGRKTSYDEITARFGPHVADIVRACSDTEKTPKPPWEERKATYIESLRTKDQPILRVSLADKLHNLRSLLVDLEGHGAEYLTRFSGSPKQLVWYFTGLSDVFTERLPGPHATELAAYVERLRSAMQGLGLLAEKYAEG